MLVLVELVVEVLEQEYLLYPLKLDLLIEAVEAVEVVLQIYLQLLQLHLQVALVLLLQKN